MKIKKRLTQAEEFEIMKLVLDKFLWIGVAIMGLGLWNILNQDSMPTGLTLIITGAIVLVAFLIIIVREFEIIA
ncbi:MAG: hypothetical protein KJ601_04555 [Nanoarchaeota archaeon]|nr:hypothetical protein [Nanoarchaeota archaeon]MBU1704321.1 hypothetical protein [Nanoarchaeota archaeon]